MEQVEGEVERFFIFWSGLGLGWSAFLYFGADWRWGGALFYTLERIEAGMERFFIFWSGLRLGWSAFLYFGAD
ncbi:hypothetical protein [Oceanobacillus sp. J11TS1]|uniref:hypothetical protein n=1 Tax=Oceanobacillus sp. J11TS1 TaxID=2807191 RepID=UPI001BB2F6F5|nr:hypothetical protein [Oceanobacillus sp. J11TS1]